MLEQLLYWLILGFVCGVIIKFVKTSLKWLIILGIVFWLIKMMGVM